MRTIFFILAAVLFSANAFCAMDYRFGDVTPIIENEVKYDGSVGGSIPAATGGVTVQHYGSGSWYKSQFTLNTTNSLGDAAGTAGYMTLQLYNFPPGAVFLAGATADLDITAVTGASGATGTMGVTNDFDGDIAFGTASYSAQGTKGTTLALTRDDIIPSTATPQASAHVTTGNCQTATAEAGTIFDGTSTAKDLYMNILIDDADQDVTSNAETLDVDGTVTIFWMNIGDY